MAEKTLPRRILSIDMGKACGWCFALKGVPTKWGTDAVVDNEFVTLLQCWRDWIEHKIDLFEPDYIVYEKPFLSMSVASQLLLQREGILLMIASDRHIPIQGVAVSTLKKVSTENGRASKEEMIKSIRFFFGADVRTDHEADALACIVWAIKNLQGESTRKRKLSLK